MLQITIPGVEKWDEDKEEFVYTKSRTISLEHSLVSISKWESKWCKSYFSTRDKTTEEVIDYIKCMTITQNVPDYVYENLTNGNIAEISAYIEAPMTATTFSNDNPKPNREIITTEIIYYWMISLNIPMECQKWHINRLLTLIRVFNIKNAPPKKINKNEILRRNAELNAARRKKMHTKG